MKKIIIGILTFAMLFTTLAMATGCSKIVKLRLEVVVYNTETETTESKIGFFRYVRRGSRLPKRSRRSERRLRTATIPTAFCTNRASRAGRATSSQLMFGGLKKSGDTFARAEQTAVPDADFEKNGTTGSNLTNSTGYLGLWRTWDSTKSFSNNGFTNSTTQIYMPKSDISSYNGYFCVFAEIFHGGRSQK